MPDLATLRLIWWFFLGILFIGFAITDGFDLGVAILFPFVTRNDTEKRIVMKTIEGVWEGNQVWIILAAGAIFAAWPYVYAVVFSGAYFLILLLLLTMGISRPVSIKYHNKLPNKLWHQLRDVVFFIGGFVPAIIFGLLIGNLLQGLPYHLDNTLRITYQGSLLQLFNPFALWCGLTGLFMLMMHGGLYLAIKTENPIRKRAIAWSKVSALLLVCFFAGGGFWVAKLLHGYQVQGDINTLGYSNPLHKQVVSSLGAWMSNYALYPKLILVPLLGFAGALTAFLSANWGNSRFAFVCSGLSIAGIIGTVGISMFPFIVPSSNMLGASLLVWDASSSRLTLLLMLGATIIFLPIILIYTSWVYHVLRGKVDRKAAEKEAQHAGY